MDDLLYVIKGLANPLSRTGTGQGLSLPQQLLLWDFCISINRTLGNRPISFIINRTCLSNGIAT